MTADGDMRQKAITLHQQGRHDAARAAYVACLADHPRDAGLWTNLGALLRNMGESDLALQAQERAFAIDPANLVVRNNLANILNDLGYHGRSLELRMGLMQAQPRQPAHGAMAGKSLRAMGDLDRARQVLDTNLARFPDHAESRIQRALTLLAAGDYAQGFTDFAARWDTGELTPRQMRTPKWQGEDLAGRTVLVLPEQGHGDVLAMARFLPVLRARGAGRVLMVVEKPLVRVMGQIDGVDWIGKHDDLRESYDIYADLMDLPRWHFAGGGDLPPPVTPHLPEDSRARARGIVAPHQGRFRIGVVWTGSQTYRGNSLRSVSHRRFHEWIGLADVQMFSLYKGPDLAGFTADGSDAFILNAGAHDRDFADCAALMEQMDLVVTTCTVTAHLAGSLGVPVWTLLHWEPFWMWGQGRDDSPWYPQMRLWRQDAPRDWDGVFARLRPALEDKTAAWRGAWRKGLS